MSTQLYHAESRCKTSIVWLPQFSSIFMMDGDLFFESILKINRKSVHGFVFLATVLSKLQALTTLIESYIPTNLVTCV